MKHIDLIAQTRNQMIKVGQALGLSHPWTVALSEDLDRLIIQEQMRRKNG